MAPQRRRLGVLGSSSPLVGLRRRLGFAEVLAQSVAAVAPSAAAVTLPGIVIGLAGGAAVPAFVVAAVIVVLVGASVTVFARRMASASGIYSYAAKALGPWGAFTTGWSVIVGYAAAAMASAFGGGLYLCRLLGVTEHGVPVALAVLLVAAAAAGLMVRGVRLSARVALALEVLSVGLLLTILLLLLVSRPSAGSGTPGAPASFDGFTLGVLLAVTAFVGFESAGTMGAESRRPLTAIPRALLWTPIGLAILFIGAAAIQSALFAGQPPSLLSGGVPVADLADQQGRPLLAYLLDLGIFSSWFACLMGSSNALVRVLFTMGREGVCPSWLGRAHRRYGTPAAAIASTMPLIGAVPLILVAHEPSRFDVFVDLLTLAGYGYVVAYALVCVAAPVFLRRIGELTPLPLITGTGAAAAIVVFVAWTVGSHGFGGGGFAVAYVVLMGLGWIRLGWVAVRDRTVLDAVGLYDEPVADDLLSVDASGSVA